MKRFLAILLIALTLSSCGANTELLDDVKPKTTHAPITEEPLSTPAEPELWEDAEVRRVGYFRNIVSGGELYYDDRSRLCFIDFATMEQHVVCEKPECDHKNMRTCPSYSFEGPAILWDGGIYYFANSPKYELLLCRADLSGGEPETVLCVPERTFASMVMVLLDSDTLYFFANTDIYGEDGHSSGKSTVLLCSYNFASGEYRELAKVLSAYNAGANLIGIFNGGLYFSTSHMETELPWEVYADPSFDIGDYIIITCYRYDLESGEIEETDGDVYYAEENYAMSTSFFGEFRVDFKNGTKASINKRFDSPVEKYIFDFYDSAVYDTEARKTFKLLYPLAEGRYFYEIIAYSGSSFIVVDPVTGEYIKAPASEVIGEAIPMPNESAIDPNAEFPYNLEWRSHTEVPEYREKLPNATIIEDRARYFEMLNPKLSERTRKYYDLFDVKPGGGLTYYFSGEHYCTVASYTSIYYAGMIIDTDIAAECCVDISFTEVNLDTHEERTCEMSFENSEGEQGITVIAYPDEGFYIMDVEIMPHFSTIRKGERGSTSVEAIKRLIEMEERAISLHDGE